MRTIFFAAFLFLTSCAALTDALEKVAAAGEKTALTGESATRLIETANVAIEKAGAIAKGVDKDGDGKWSWGEIVGAIGALGGGGWLVKRNSASGVAKAVVATKVDDQAERLAKIETMIEHAHPGLETRKG